VCLETGKHGFVGAGGKVTCRSTLTASGSRAQVSIVRDAPIKSIVGRLVISLSLCLKESGS
jgi:hypothetical protein